MTTFQSTRLITDDVAAMAAFYELVSGVAAQWATADFAEIVTGRATLAIGSTRTVPVFGAGSAVAASNNTAILEFMVDDVDAEWERLRDDLTDVVLEPTTMPWGNRTLLCRDPDGSLVGLFTPVTDEAKARFAGR